MITIQDWARGSLRIEGRRWILRLRENGAERRITLGPKSLTRREAREAADLHLEALGILATDRGEHITLARYAREFLTVACAQRKAATRAAYASALNVHILPALGELRLSAIGLRQYSNLVSSLMAAKRSAATVRLVVNVLRQVQASAAALGYSARITDLSPLKLGKFRELEAPMRCISPAELAAILKYSAQPWRSFYALMGLAGLRSGEALALDWSHVDLAGRLLKIKQGSFRGHLQTTKSVSSTAPVPIEPRLAAILAEYATILGGTPAGLLFASPRDPKRPYWPSSIRRTLLAPLLKKLGLPPAGLHAFRHGYADGQIRAGAAPPVVQKNMRHADLKTTMRYVHVTLEDQRSAAAAYSSVIGNCAT